MPDRPASYSSYPLLLSAISALDTIKPADIKLVQSFKNPPGGIKVVMEAVCVLLDVKPTRCKWFRVLKRGSALMC